MTTWALRSGGRGVVGWMWVCSAPQGRVRQGHATRLRLAVYRCETGTFYR